GVQMFDAMVKQRLVRQDRETVSLSPRGERFVEDFGIDLASIGGARRPLCKTCLDWSARRSHLAGSLGSAMLARMYELKWASREAGSRIVSFTRNGERQFQALFGTETPQVLAAKAG
ncbi:MAG TPA: transcriptional regulator, partial [Hyphomicrobiaceae bacterium]|nr:transcriptional regulator [Hyphomicrobiaceae bacterium]